MVKVPHKTLERSLFADGYRHVIGIDEVGMGCLAGPVVVCAAQFSRKFYDHKHQKLHWLRDSKMLQAHQREAFARELMSDRNLRYCISIVYPREIDTLNIFHAARAGMRRAIKSIVSLSLRSGSRGGKVMVLVDGPHRVPGIGHEQMPIVKGDRNIFAIACASIIAKVYRDAMMSRYAKRYRGYEFHVHKGYATRLHRNRLLELGPSPIHRRSFHWKVN